MLWKGFQKPKRLEVDRETPHRPLRALLRAAVRAGLRHDGRQRAAPRAALVASRARPSPRCASKACSTSSRPIPGAMEDTTDLILNLKRMPAQDARRAPEDAHPQDVGGRARCGPKHITPDPDIEILDPEAYIATLGAGLDAVAWRCASKQGRGYVSADKNFDEDLSIGWIPVDSVHSPIKKVNYFVENARVGQATDYEKLTLEVWTNGAVSPRDAVGLAAKLMKDHLAIFINIEEDDERAAETPVEIDEPDRELDGEARARASTSWSCRCARTTA